jgi:chromosome segregation ATPase
MCFTVVHIEKKKVSSLETEIGNLKSSLQDLENQKVSLEMKTVDLEEQIDILTKEKMELVAEIEAASDKKQEHAAVQTTITEGENGSDTSKWFQSLELLGGREEEDQLPAATAENEAVRTSLQHLKAELLSSDKLIEEQKEIIMDLKCKIDSRDEEIEMQNEIIKKLEHLSGNYSDRDDGIAEIVKELSDMAGDLEEWKTRCTEVEKRLQGLGDEKMELEKRFTEVKSENSMLSQELAKQREVASDLASKLKEQTSAISGRDERISSLQGLMEQNGQMLEAREMTLKDVHEKLNNVEKQYELRLLELRSSLANKEKEVLDMTSALMHQESVLRDKETEITELSETLQKLSQEFASLQQHLSAVEENVFLEFRTQLDEMSVSLAEKDNLNCQFVEECHKHRQQIESLKAELSDKVQVITTLEAQTEKFKEVELQLQSAVSNLKACEEELSALKQELVLKHSEVEDKTDKLKQVERKVTELTEKNKKFIANLKAKAIAIKGQEQKLQQYETVVQAKEKLISELTAQNEELLKHQADETDSVQQLETIHTLTREVNEERSRTELISDELGKATEKIVSLERELKLSECKLEEMSLMREISAEMTGKVSELKQEIGVIQTELRNRDDEARLLEKDKIRLIEEGRAKEQWVEEKNSLLEGRIKELEAEVMKQTERLEGLVTEKNGLLQQLLSYSDSVAKVGELEEQVRIRDHRLAEFEEQSTSSFEINKQSLSAVEAKLQEREAVVESLEQALAKATERVQHLEEGLVFAEERRHSLESKAEALNVRLQESDRVKEEVVENEEMLEQRLAVLVASEETLKKKLEVLSVGSEELTLRVADLSTENVGLRKEIVNMESTVKELQKELDRLSPFEYSFMQASEKVEAVEAELKRAVTEHEHRMKDKVLEIRQHAENLETDLRNVSIQLEQAELEKRTLIERYEKLNDEKVRLDDEVEGLSHILEVHKQTISDLNEELQEKLYTFETVISEKEVSRKELEERVQMLEKELQEKTSAYEEKERVASELNAKIGLLEGELSLATSAVDAATSEKEEIKNELNERITLLENELEGTVSSFENTSSEKDKLHRELQEVVQFQEAELKRYQHMLEVTLMQSQTETDSDVSRIDSEERIGSLTAELEHLKSVLIQKDNEIGSYQTRLLQLQFGNIPDGGHGGYPTLRDKVSHLEDSNIKLQNTVHIREAQITDLRVAMGASSTELEQLRSELESYHNRVEELTKRLDVLQDEATNKSNYIKQLQMTLAETEVNFLAQLESTAQEYELKLSSLEKDNEELFKELLKARAQQEVADIVRVAEELVQNKNTVLQEPDHRPKSVTFRQTAQERSDSFGSEDRVKALQEELRPIRSERDEALLRITELASRVAPASGDTVLMIEDNDSVRGTTEVNDPWKQINRVQRMSDTEHSIGQDTLGGVVLQGVAPGTVLNLGSSNWDMGIEGEEEGWGWGSDEARLEEEHIRKQRETLLCSEPSDALNYRIITLENRIKDVTAEKDKLGEELHAAQVRSGKLLKKLKDLKLKNDSLLKENIELTKRSGHKNFGDLDQAIEEELKIRIDTLEKEVKEVRNEKDAAYGQKERLEGHIDMLTRANEKLVEMKEKQDRDSEMWKQSSRDLSNQVQALEWRIEELMEENKYMTEANMQRNQGERESVFSWDKHGFASDNKSLIDAESTNIELQEQVAALSADNENLQKLLEQQRNLRLTAEAELQKIQQRRSQMDAETQSLSGEGDIVKERSHIGTEHEAAEELKQECDSLKEEKNNFQNAYRALKTEYERMCTESEQYVLATEKKYEALQFEYTKKIEDVCDEKIKIEEYYRNVLKERNRLAEDLQQLSTNLADLTQKHEALELEYSDIKEHLTVQEKALDFENEQKLGLEFELVHLRSQMESHPLGLTDTSGLLPKQQMRISELEVELRTKTEEIEKLRHSIENQKLEQAQVEQEWNGRLERCRKELELSAEELLRQKSHHSMLAKEYQELRDHNDELIRYHVQEALNAKEQEIAKLEVRLAEKGTTALELKQGTEEEQRVNEWSELLSARDKNIESLETKLTERENEIEQISSMRDRDIDNFKIMLSEREHKFGELLGLKDHDIYNLQVQLREKDARIFELQQTLDEEARQLTELRELLEDRELQLRQLKDELTSTRSKEAQDLSVMPKQPQGSFPGSVADENSSSVEDSLERRGRKDSSSSDAQQGELDLALYMLHQRDVRCDELTLELMQVRLLMQPDCD